ncbi:hypothetical protein HK102_004868, partial [Quaeritorhiza haematococci]
YNNFCTNDPAKTTYEQFATQYCPLAGPSLTQTFPAPASPTAGGANPSSTLPTFSNNDDGKNGNGSLALPGSGAAAGVRIGGVVGMGVGVGMAAVVGVLSWLVMA